MSSLKGGKKRNKKELEELTVLFSIRATGDYVPKEKCDLKMKEGDLANVIEQIDETSEYIVVKEDKKLSIGYIPQKICERQIRKLKKSIPFFPEDYIKFLEMKKYGEKHTRACIKIQRFYRWMKTRKVFNKKLDKMGERIFLKNELLENDNNYLRYLETVYALFFEPLKEVLTVEEHDGVFANFEKVLTVAREINKGIEEKSVLGLVGELDKLKVNSEYISNYSAAMEVFKKLKSQFMKSSSDPKSQKFLETMKRGEKDNRCCGLNFQNLLIKPFQRLVTYQNIISSILKVTPKESYQHEIIEELLVKTKELCGLMNQQRKSRIEEESIKEMGVYIKGRKLIFKDVVLPVEIEKERFNGECFLFNDLFYIKKDEDESYSFHFFLTEFSEDQRQKKWMNLKSIYSSARVMFKKRKEKTQWMDSIQSSVTKTKILAKRRHGIENISKLLQDFKYIRFEKNAKFDEMMNGLQKRKDDQLNEITFKKKQIQFLRLLIRNKMNEMLQNYDEILKHYNVIDGVTQEMNDTRLEKQHNIAKCMDDLGKFRECLNNDILEFYKIFEKDFSFCSRELEILKIPHVSPSCKAEKRERDLIKKVLESDKNPIDILFEKGDETKALQKQIDKMKRKMQLISFVEDRLDLEGEKEEEEEGEKEEEGEEQEEKKASPFMMKKEDIDSFLKKKAKRMMEKVKNLNGVVMKLELNVDTLKEEKKDQEQEFQERIEELKKEAEEERVRAAGFKETIQRKKMKKKELKKELEETKLELEKKDRIIQRMKEQLELMKGK